MIPKKSFERNEFLPILHFAYLCTMPLTMQSHVIALPAPTALPFPVPTRLFPRKRPLTPP